MPVDDKPDSVKGRPFIYVYCCQYTFARYPFSFLRARTFTKVNRELLALARGGVYLRHACHQARGALLPHLFTLTCEHP